MMRSYRLIVRKGQRRRIGQAIGDYTFELESDGPQSDLNDQITVSHQQPCAYNLIGADKLPNPNWKQSK